MIISFVLIKICIQQLRIAFKIYGLTLNPQELQLRAQISSTLRKICTSHKDIWRDVGTIYVEAFLDIRYLMLIQYLSSNA